MTNNNQQAFDIRQPKYNNERNLSHIPTINIEIRINSHLKAKKHCSIYNRNQLDKNILINLPTKNWMQNINNNNYKIHTKKTQQKIRIRVNYYF